jgi:hypothetical protein
LVDFGLARKNEEDTWQLAKRLDAIINVLLETARVENKPLSMSKKIAILHAAGLRPIEISRILGKSVTYVSVELTRIRKSEKVR